MALRYRIWVGSMMVIAVAAGPAIFVGAGLNTSFSGPARLTAEIVISFCISMAVFRSTAATTGDIANVIPIAIAVAGHVPDALVLSAVVAIGPAIRKPIVPHLLVYNIVMYSFATIIAGAAFTLAAGHAGLFSLQWTVGVVIAVIMATLFEIPAFYVTSVVGGYIRSAQVPAIARSSLFDASGSTLPFTAFLAAALSHPGFVPLGFLFAPLVVTARTFRRTDELVDARLEAQTDALTGLANRRAMFDELQRAIAGLPKTEAPERRTRAGRWVGLLDLDNFKRLNDTRGHDAGDEALKVTAHQLSASIRDVDFCARYGGEEFMILLGEVSDADVTAIFERIRGDLECALEPWNVTASIGAHPLTPSEDPMAALSRADQAMYIAKQNGKNQVVFSNDADHAGTNTSSRSAA